MRKHPHGSIILWAFTLACSVVVGMACAFTPKDAVALAAGTTLGITICLTVYAMKTTRDFTGCGPYLFTALCGLIVASLMVGIVAWATGEPMFEARRAMAAFGAVLFSMFIVYDVQKIVGGRAKKIQYEVDDYNLAAMNLYLDIINLFLELLELYGRR
jgi:FtsH-binding integral membrane protein